jgi:hypothetical protein
MSQTVHGVAIKGYLTLCAAIDVTVVKYFACVGRAFNRDLNKSATTRPSWKGFAGNWVVSVLRVEVEGLYLVLKIHEFFEYEVIQCDPPDGKSHVFQ